MNKEEFNKKFGVYVQTTRIEKGWSQANLATKMGNNPQNISRIERGEVSPTLYWISLLAEAFEMDLGDFIVEFSKVNR